MDKNVIDNLLIMDKLSSKSKYKWFKGGFLMLTVTDKASEVIKDFLKDKDQAAAVRITMSIGWSGPSLGMALDEPKNEDEIFEEKGTKFIIDKDLLSQAKPINVDFVSTANGSGFKLSSGLTAEEGAGCGSCSC